MTDTLWKQWLQALSERRWEALREIERVAARNLL